MIRQNSHDTKEDKPIIKTHDKKMKMWTNLTENEHLDDRSKELLEKFGHNLFGN